MLACSLFDELGSKSNGGGDGGSDSGGGDESEGGAIASCIPAQHDRCLEQDVLQSCMTAGGNTLRIQCDELCGDNVNVTCLATSIEQHGCWCAAPGRAAQSTCAELEACILRCNFDIACSDTCLTRSDATTMRLFGALVYCAQAGCEETCMQDASTCGLCVQTKMTGADGDCAVERTLCGDETDTPFPWPS